MTVAPPTPRTINFTIYETGVKVGGASAINIQEALDDWWDAFLEPDGGYEKKYIGGNFILCLYDGEPRTFIARAEQ